MDNSHYQSLINNLKQTLFQINEYGQWVYLNAEWEQLTGFKVADTLGKEIIQFIHPDDNDEYQEFIQQLYDDGEVATSLKIRFLTKNNCFCWVNMRANIYADPINNEQNNIVGVISDITERIREYDLHQATHRTLSGLINNLCGLVYRGRNDRDWTMEFVSDGCLALTGYRASELINKTVTFGSLINPNDQDLVWTNVQSALREHRAYELNYRIYTNQNEEKWVWERGQGNFASNGELLNIEGFIVDITDYKRNRQRENEEILYRTKTKLPQKQLFMDRLNSAIARRKTIHAYNYALLLIRIDKFKKLKARFSAAAIDKIVTAVIDRITTTLLPTASLCQFDDASFGLLLEHVASIYRTRAVIKDIQTALLSPINIGTTEIYITVSIGVYLSNTNNDERDIVINNVYSALSDAESLGGARYEIFDEEYNAKIYALDRMEKEISYALKNGGLETLYWPLGDIAKNLTANIEAQLFWQHPRMGRVSADFFGALTQHDQITMQLNHWLVKSVLEQATLWQQSATCNHALNIAIEFFGEPLLLDNFLFAIAEQLIAIDNKRLHFSIGIGKNTIGALQGHQVDIINKLHRTQQISFFFTSHCFVLELTKDLFNLPINLVKFDYSCYQPAAELDLKLAGAQIAYLKQLGKEVIVANVNKQKDYELVSTLAPDYIHGELISPPLSENQLAQKQLG